MPDTPAWASTSDPDLFDIDACHESSGVLRMKQAGMSSAEICRELGISRQQLVHEMNLAEDEEKHAEFFASAPKVETP